MTERPRRKEHAAAGARVLATGVAAAAGIGLVGAMALSAQAEEPAPPAVVRRVVIPQGQTVVVIEQAEQQLLDIPVVPRAPARSVAPPVTESAGS